jgi:hypothetical protein
MREISRGPPPDTPVTRQLMKIADDMLNSAGFRRVVAASRALDERAAYLRARLGRPAIADRTAPRRGTGSARKGESGGADRQSPMTSPSGEGV